MTEWEDLSEEEWVQIVAFMRANTTRITAQRCQLCGEVCVGDSVMIDHFNQSHLEQAGITGHTSDEERDAIEMLTTHGYVVVKRNDACRS